MSSQDEADHLDSIGQGNSGTAYGIEDEGGNKDIVGDSAQRLGLHPQFISQKPECEGRYWTNRAGYYESLR